ncbi:MAG: hypothetical protein ACYCO9_19010 [Streptosporangiaceae bacterium]
MTGQEQAAAAPPELAFGDRVSLGGFVSVTALTLALLLSRALVRRLLSLPR